MLLNARRIDHLGLVLLAFEDVTARRRLERQQQAIQGELAHRLKNALAVVQSMAVQTKAATVDGFRSAIIGRMQALALAHGVLIEAQWRPSDLSTLIGRILAPHVARGGSDRVRLEGPPVELSAEHATAFALIVHELATNSVKYGALSLPSGTVLVRWSFTANRLLLEWSDHGGPPVAASRKAGFGTRLITRTAAYQFGGQAELFFEPEGLLCRLDIPLTE